MEDNSIYEFDEEAIKEKLTNEFTDPCSDVHKALDRLLVSVMEAVKLLTDAIVEALEETEEDDGYEDIDFTMEEDQSEDSE